MFALGDVAGPAAVQGPEASGANFPATAQVNKQLNTGLCWVHAATISVQCCWGGGIAVYT